MAFAGDLRPGHGNTDAAKRLYSARASFVSSERRYTPMLAEKFFLVLEMLKSFTSTDGSPIVVSTAQFVPVTLPRRTK